MIVVPERHAIEKAFRIFVGKLQSPVFARVGGFVNARLLAGSGAQQIREVGAEGFHIAEVESVGAGDLGGLPGISAVGGAEISSVSATGPRDSVREHADAAQVFGGVGFLDGGVLGGESGSEKKKQKSAHAMIVPDVADWVCIICVVEIFRATRKTHVTCSAGDLLWRD